MKAPSTLHIIVAMSDNGAIGVKGDMPWGRSIPRDLKHFKEITLGYPVIMGRKTFESLPKGALPGRQNIVITRNKDFSAPGIELAHSLDEARALAHEAEHIFIIGGGELYRMALPVVDRLHITLVHGTWAEADTFFPPIDLDKWRCTESEYHSADDRNLFDVTFTTFERIIK